MRPFGVFISLFYRFTHLQGCPMAYLIRRITTYFILLGTMIMALSASSSAQTASSEAVTAYDFTFPAIDGTQMALDAFKGRPLLIVNTASACGFTPQYDGLQALHEAYAEKGLVVIGVPSNDFGKQETGTSAEIATFCEVNFNIRFPLADKIKVKGDDAHPFYQWAKSQVGFASRPRWNFHKYLIGRDGQIVDWFSSMTSPDSDKMIKAIESVL